MNKGQKQIPGWLVSDTIAIIGTLGLVPFRTMVENLEELSTKGYELSLRDDGEALLPDFLSACSRLFTAYRSDRLSQVEVILEVAYLLHRWPYSTVIWDWFRANARNAERKSDREDLTTSLFELLPEEPRDEKMLEIFFTFLSDPKTEWAVFEAYRCKGALFWEDLQIFCPNEATRLFWEFTRYKPVLCAPQ
jgi:hypothetical protein